MSVYKQAKSKNWWYKFHWNGELIRESTKQTNKRVAEQMEAAHKTALAKGEVGLREKTRVPTLQEFAAADFLPFIRSRFQNKPKTLEYYTNGVNRLNAFEPLAGAKLDAVSIEIVSAFIKNRRAANLQVSSINRELEVLRRMLKLAAEWGKLDRVPPRIQMLPGENHRDRVLSRDEEQRYLEAATLVGEQIKAAYVVALDGVRATQRGQQPHEPQDPFLLRDVTTILIECGLRPEECFRLTWENVRDGCIHIPYGKTPNARRTIPLSPRLAALLEMRKASARSATWVFPASTRSGHIEKSTLKKQHPKTCKLAGLAPFPLYTFRHTCLTGWAAFMDPYTLGYLAGHSDFGTTKRYVHPQPETTRAAIARARLAAGGHTSGHTDASAHSEATAASAVIN